MPYVPAIKHAIVMSNKLYMIGLDSIKTISRGSVSSRQLLAISRAWGMLI
jgi:hypothetical protein